MLGDLSMSEGERSYDGVVLQRNGQELADEEHTLEAEGYALNMSDNKEDKRRTTSERSLRSRRGSNAGIPGC